MKKKLLVDSCGGCPVWQRALPAQPIDNLLRIAGHGNVIAEIIKRQYSMLAVTDIARNRFPSIVTRARPASVGASCCIEKTHERQTAKANEKDGKGARSAARHQGITDNPIRPG